MNDQVLAAITVFCAIMALALVPMMFLGRNEKFLRRRLTTHIVEVEDPGGKRLERISLLKDDHIGAIPSENAYFTRLRAAESTGFELIRAGKLPKTRRFMLTRMTVAFVAGLVAYLIFHNVILAILPAILGYHIPRVVLRRKGQARLKAFEGQFAEAIDLLVGALRAGHGFLQGLDSVADQIGDPIRSELKQVLEEVNVGISPDEALEAMGNRIPSYDLGLMISAISVQRQTGGNLAEVLENLAATVRERRRVRGEVMALTTGPRVSSYVLAAVPVLLFIYFFAISKDYRQVMTGTSYGWMLLGTASVLTLIGFVTSRKVAIVEY
jgi:tight adherence protein B